MIFDVKNMEDVNKAISIVHWDDLDEDMLYLRFPNGWGLDVGWYININTREYMKHRSLKSTKI